MTLSPCQNAPLQEKGQANASTEVAAQAPLPPDEHKAVRWKGGDRRKNTKSKAAAGTEKKDDVVANVGVPHEEKVDVVRRRQNFSFKVNGDGKRYYCSRRAPPK